MVAGVRPHLPLGLLSLLVLAACPPVGGDSSTGPGPGPATSGDEPTGTGTTDACVGSGECDSEGICVADYEAADTMPPGGMRGTAECAPESACIGALDLGRWCFDHRSCCDDLRCRPADGTCEPATLGQTTGSDSLGDTSTGDTSTGTGASTTGDTGSTTGDISTGASDTGASSTG